MPDGDTGTNMALTLESVTDELDGLDSPDLDATCRAIAHGSLMGARGNSGVILSQLLRGLSEGLNCATGRPGPLELSEALTIADKLAREAVMRPVEGTILTVARGAAEGARSAAEAGKPLVDVAEASRDGAADALARTPSLLPVLEQAGVVDAGGTGLLLLLDALLTVVDGRPMPLPPEPPDTVFGPLNPEAPGTAARSPSGSDDAAAAAQRALAGLRYEVMYLLEAPDETIPSFKEVWAGIGDSIVVVGGDGLWNCHIHTDDIGAAIEACLDAGRPRNVRVTDLLEEVEEERWVREGAGTVGSGPSATPPGPAPTTGVVAVATGDGIGRIFRSLGVQGLIAGGQSMNPSTAELVEAVEAVRSDSVIILPNNGNIRPVAERVDDLTDKSVWVVPTRHHRRRLRRPPGLRPRGRRGGQRRDHGGLGPQAWWPARSPGPSATPTAGPARSRPATGWGCPATGSRWWADSLAGAACALLDTLVAESHSLVTIIEGEGSGAGDTRRITEWLRDRRPDVETEVHHGGQPLYPYLFSIE